MTSGLDAIRESIVREARDGAAALIKEANDERNRILAEARERAKVTGFQLLEEAKSEAQLRYEEKLGAIRTDLRRRLLRKREEIIETAWNRALEKLREYVQTPDYAKALRKLTVDTAELVEGDSFRVSANRKDLEILGESKAEIEGMLGSPGRRMIIGDALDCIGGVRVSDPDGKVVLDRTYESRMRRVKPELRSKIAQILTGGLG